MFFPVRLMLPALWMAACLVSVSAVRVQGQDDVKISKQELEELKRKAAEADRLQQQLNQAQQEIQALKSTNVTVVPVVRDSNNRVVPLPAAVLQAVTNAPPTPPLASLPAVGDDSVINVNDLLTYFETDPAAADARFKQREFAIRGIVTDLKKPILRSFYEVNLRLPGHPLYVECIFRIPEEFDRVYVSSNGEEMIGHGHQARTVFARVGAELTIRGYCDGVKDHAVRLGDCQYLVVPGTAR